MSDTTETLNLANKFFAALERGDSRAIAECYGPGMLVWNNVLQRDLPGKAHIAALEAHFFGRYLQRKYIDPRTDLMEGGFVRQQVLTASLDGQPVHMPICLVCRVSNGQLIRIDEYLTIAAPAEIARATAAAGVAS
jgi:ketosteroid isomerase-like protein